MPEKIDVLAKIMVRIPESELELGINWTDAARAKAQAAEWLSKIDRKILPLVITVLVEIEQRSDDVPNFKDKGTWYGLTDVELAIQHGCKFLTSYSTWGRTADAA